MCPSKKTKTKHFNTTEKEEDWIEYIKRSTKEAEEHMKKIKYLAGLITAQKIEVENGKKKYLLTRKWTKKIFDWHPGLDNKIKTRRPVGRPKRRWEDDINGFLKTRRDKGKRKV